MKKYTRKFAVLLSLLLTISYLLAGCGSQATDMEQVHLSEAARNIRAENLREAEPEENYEIQFQTTR